MACGQLLASTLAALVHWKVQDTKLKKMNLQMSLSSGFFLLNFDLSYNRTKFIQLFRVLSTLGPHKLRCWHAGPLEDVKCSTKGKPSRTWSVIASRKVEAVPTLAGFDPGLSRWPRFELIFIDQFGRSIGDEVQSAVLREVVTAGNNSKRPMLAKCLLVLECSREIPWQR